MVFHRSLKQSPASLCLAFSANSSQLCLNHCKLILRAASPNELSQGGGTEECIFQEFGRHQWEAPTGLWQRINFQQLSIPATPDLPPAGPRTAAILWEAVAACLPLKGKWLSPPPAETPPGILSPELEGGGHHPHSEIKRKEKKWDGGRTTLTIDPNSPF